MFYTHKEFNEYSLTSRIRFVTAIKQVQLNAKNYNFNAGLYDMPGHKRDV